jgi:hypothetical protein
MNLNAGYSGGEPIQENGSMGKENSPKSRQSRSGFRLFVATALLLLFMSPTWPQIPLRTRDPLKLEARIGWDSAVRAGAWTPVTVWVDWRGDREIDGIVRVRDTNLTEPGQVHESRVTLAPPSRKRLDFTLPFTPGAGEVVVEFHSRALPETREIRRSPRHWLDGDDVLVVVVAGERNAVPSALHEWCRRFSARTTGTEAVAVGITPRDLTDHWADYEPVDVLVFLDCGDARFEPTAARAVAEWVKAGGRMVVSGKLDPVLIEHTPIWALLPVTPTSIRSTDSLPPPLHEIVRRRGEGWFFREYEPRPEADARRWPRNAGIPVLVDHSVGGGWAAFSPLALESEPLAAGEGGVQFWSYLFLQSRAEGFPLLAVSPLREDPNPWWGYRYGAPDSPPFPLTALAIYLGAYFLLVGPVNYFYLRRRARFGLVWITVPALSILFFLLAYLGGRLMWGNRMTIREISLIEVLPSSVSGPGSSPARIVSRFRISSPSRRSYDLLFEEGDVCVTQVLPRNPDSVKVRGFRVRENTGTELVDLGFNMWSSRFVYAHLVGEVSGTIRGTASISDGRLRGSARANMPFEFERTYVYYKGGYTPMDLVSEGALVSARGAFEMGASGGQGRPNPFPHFAPEDGISQGEKTFRHALYYLETSYGLSGSGEPWFIGVREEPAQNLLLDGRRTEGARSSVYLAALPISSDRGTIDLSAGLWRKEFQDPGGIISAGYRGYYEITQAGEVTWDFYLPPFPQPFTVRDVRILANTRLLEAANRFEIRDHGQAVWVELPRTGAQREGNTVVEPPNEGPVNRFLEAETGRLSLRMNFDGRGAIHLNASPGTFYGPDRDPGFLDLIEVTARGVTQ